MGPAVNECGTVDPWTKQGLGVASLQAVKHLSIIYSQHPESVLPLHLRSLPIHRFTPQQIMQYYDIYYWKKFHVQVDPGSWNPCCSKGNCSLKVTNASVGEKKKKKSVRQLHTLPENFHVHELCRSFQQTHLYNSPNPCQGCSPPSRWPVLLLHLLCVITETSPCREAGLPLLPYLKLQPPDSSYASSAVIVFSLSLITTSHTAQFIHLVY